MNKKVGEPITTGMLTEILDERFAGFREEMRKAIHTLDEKLDKIIGMFTKFDEEQTLQGGRISDHEERLEVVEKKLHIAS